MIITKIEIIKCLDCENVILEFPLQPKQNSVLIVQSMKKCHVISTAIQLICSMRFADKESLNILEDKLFKGRITLSFLLPSIQKEEEEQLDEGPGCSNDPLQKLKKRRKSDEALLKNGTSNESKKYIKITATRDFVKNPFIIEYTLDGSGVISKTIEVFQLTFFTTTNVMFPNLLQLTYGQNLDGKLANMILFDNKEDNLLREFSSLFYSKIIDLNNVLSKLVTIILTSRYAVQLSRTSCTLQILLDIRHIFEYITCSEYTVWFLFPTESGVLSDVVNITQHIKFDKVQTMLGLKTNITNSKIQWFEAEQHIQELLFISIQLALAHHCHQKFVFFNNLEHLIVHQNLEVFNAIVVSSRNSINGYLHQIADVCTKLGITSVIEFSNSLHFPILKTFYIKCEWLNDSWKMNVIMPRRFQSQAFSKFFHLINQTS